MLCRYVLPFVALPDVQAFAQSCSSSRQVLKRLGNGGLLRLAQVRPEYISTGTTPVVISPTACNSALGFSTCHRSQPPQPPIEASRTSAAECQVSEIGRRILGHWAGKCHPKALHACCRLVIATTSRPQQRLVTHPRNGSFQAVTACSAKAAWCVSRSSPQGPACGQIHRMGAYMIAREGPVWECRHFSPDQLHLLQPGSAVGGASWQHHVCTISMTTHIWVTVCFHPA